MLDPTSNDLQQCLSVLPGAVGTGIQDQIGARDFRGVFDSWSGLPEVDATVLVGIAACYSVAPISGHRVGAVAIGGSGRLYAGANMEFPGAPTSASLHAEQSAVLNAWIHGETSIPGIAVSTPPCGHCRQFLMELPEPRSVRILVAGHAPVTLEELLPMPFLGDRTEGRNLLDSAPCILDTTGEVIKMRHLMAVEEAQLSYAPYTHSPEGFIIGTSDGAYFPGRTAECAAFNPGVTAIVCALNQRNLSASRGHAIMSAANARLTTSLSPQKKLAKAILSSLTNVTIEKILLEPCQPELQT